MRRGLPERLAGGESRCEDRDVKKHMWLADVHRRGRGCKDMFPVPCQVV